MTGACLCEKLRHQQYTSICSEEIELLRTAQSQAPFLFEGAEQPSPSCPRKLVNLKRKRTSCNTAARARKQQRHTFNSTFNTLHPTSAPATATAISWLPDKAQCPGDKISLEAANEALNTQIPTDSISDSSLNISHPTLAEVTIISPLPDGAKSLLDTVSLEGAEKTLEASVAGYSAEVANIPSDLDAFTRVFMCTYQLSCKIERGLWLHRIFCFGLAKLHSKGSSFDPFVQTIQNEFPHISNPRDKMQNWIRIGKIWIEHLEKFANYVSSTEAIIDPKGITGLFCILRSPSRWERAKVEDVELALQHLSTSHQERAKTIDLAPQVNDLLKSISLQQSFVDETSKVIQNAQPLPAVAMASPSERNGDLPTPSLTPSGPTRDADMIGKLVSFFAPSQQFTQHLLCRGGSHRRRWTKEGGIEEVDAMCAGLWKELAAVLSDAQRLSDALNYLKGTLLQPFDQGYVLNDDMSGRIRKSLSADDLRLWQSQALIVVYRAIPWKYIEITSPHVALILPHLQHAIETSQALIESLYPYTKRDLCLALLEASRFPIGMSKGTAITGAAQSIRNIEDWYHSTRLKTAQCSVYRIDGHQTKAGNVLDQVESPPNPRNRSINFAVGQLAVQRSLNSIQVEDLTHARQILESWVPDEDPSMMEQVVVFRKHLILGRMSRYQGEFYASLEALERCRDLIQSLRQLDFDEDLRDLTCELADTLRELDRNKAAEQCLRKELQRWDQGLQSSVLRGRSLLEACLAEVLFAQGQHDEAERRCFEAIARPRLMKVAKLRFTIVLAKIYQTRSDYNKAMEYWNKACRALSAFPMTNGYTTSAILFSAEVALKALERHDMEAQNAKVLEHLKIMANPMGTRYWIAGLRHWISQLRPSYHL